MLLIFVTTLTCAFFPIKRSENSLFRSVLLDTHTISPHFRHHRLSYSTTTYYVQAHCDLQNTSESFPFASFFLSSNIEGPNFSLSLPFPCSLYSSDEKGRREGGRGREGTDWCQQSYEIQSGSAVEKERHGQIESD